MHTEYRSHRILFSENADDWYCSDFSFTHAKLSKVKEHIDKQYRKLRSESAVRCLIIPTSGSYEMIAFRDATIVEYGTPDRAKTHAFQRVGDGEIVSHNVYVMAERHGEKRPSRKSCALSSLAIDNERNHQIMGEAQDLQVRIKSLQSALQSKLAEITRVSPDMIEGLIRASQTTLTEGDV